MSLDGPDENPIHATLNAAGVPWQLPRASLAKRYGIRSHAAYSWEVIEIESAQPIVKGLLWPLSVQVFPQFSPYLPATEFSGIAYHGEDAHENLRLTAKQLTSRLGEAEIADNSNTFRRRWTFGAASLKLTVWPPDLQRWPMKNPAHEHDPRLKTGCHVSIKTGFRKTATAEELVWLKSFEPIDRIQIGHLTASSVRRVPAEQGELEFVREPVADLADIFGLVGCSADRAALVFFGTQLYLVPMADVIGFHVARILPAKGPGGSRLEVECRTNYESLATKRLTISSASGVEDLNDLASAISTATGKSFELGNYDYDM